MRRIQMDSKTHTYMYRHTKITNVAVVVDDDVADIVAFASAGCAQVYVLLNK